MNTNDLVKRLFFILLMLKTGGVTMAVAQDDGQPPVPPMTPTTPDAQRSASTQHSVQHFTQNNQSISMQIIGETPVITDQAQGIVSFTNGSYIQVMIRETDNSALTTIRWDSTGCVAMQAGESRSCNQAEREQMLRLIRQLPTPPVPPAH